MKPPVVAKTFSNLLINNSAILPAIQSYAIRLLDDRLTHGRMSGLQRIGETRIRIIDCRRAGSEPRYGDWMGTAMVDGNKKTFTAGCKLKRDNEYWVVYEQNRIFPSRDGIRIHSIIGECKND